MKLSGPIVTASILAAALATAYAQERRGVWPPPLQPASDTSPVLAPDASMKTMVLPPGYRLELVVSEPMIQDPVFIDWDADGRMWAIEMPGYMIDITASRELEPLGRVVVFEDTNKDGRMDKRTVFADGLVLARALKVLHTGVLVGEPPNLWLMKDTNGDLKMDTKELVTDDYGRREANVEHNANGLFWAMDNWIYTAESDVYLRLKDGKFEVRKTLSRGQWGLTQDDQGRVFRNSNSSALHVDIVPTPYFLRNPTQTRTRGSYEFLGQDGNDLNIVWPAHPTRGVNRGYQTGTLRPDGTLATFTAVGAPTIYRGDRLPAELRGNAFLAEPSGNLVSRVIIDDDGRTLRGRKAYAGRRIRGLDRRALPAGLLVLGAGRNALHRRPVSRHHSAQGLHHRVPAGPDPVAQPRTADRKGAHLSRGTRHDEARHQPRRSPRRARPHSWRRCRIPTAGGATPRSACSSSATTSRWSGHCRSSRSARRIRGPGSMRSGRWTGWTTSIPRPSCGRWPIRREMFARRRFASPNDGFVSPITPFTPP